MFGQAIVSLIFSFCFYRFFTSIFAIAWGSGHILSGGIGDGIRSVWNQIAATLGNSDYILLDTVKGGSGETGLIVTLLFVLTAILGLIFLRIGARWPFIAAFLALAGVYMFTKARGNDVSGLLLMAATCLACFSATPILSTSKASKAEIVGKIGLKGASLVVVLALLIVLAINSPNQQRLAIISPGMIKAQDKAAGIFDGLRYGKNSLKEGRLSQEIKAEEPEGIALELRAEKGKKIKPMYLRGFVGSTFSEGSWTDADPSLYYSVKDLMYYLDKGKLDLNHQLARSFELASNPSGEDKTINIDLKNVGASRRYLYLPYTETDNTAKAKTYPGAYSLAKGIRGQGSYSFRVIDDGYWMWTDRTAQMFANGLNDKKREYYKEESHYNNYLYSNLTRLPDEMREPIEDLLGPELRTKEGHVSYKTAIANVKKALVDKRVYSSLAGPGKEGVNRINSFLEEAKGYDSHFASAATMMFRYYGIPARYVEGYVVSDGDIKKAKDGLVQVPKKNNHAWTEIYIDGMGFVPIEMSQPYIETMRQADMTRGLSSEESLNPYNFPSQNVKQRPPEKGREKKEDFPWDELIFFIAMALLIGLIAIILFLIANALWLAYSEKQVFMQADPKKGAAAIYGAILDLEEEGQKLIQEGSPMWGPANRAAFSRQTVTEEERSQLLGLLKDLRKAKKEEKKRRG